MGLQGLIAEANKEINNDKAKVAIKIQAGIVQNCFEVLLDFTMSFMENAKALINTESAKDIKEILEWIGIGAGGAGSLFWLYKKFKGAPIDGKDIISSDDEGISIKNDDGQVLVIKSSVINLYNNIVVTKHARTMLSALECEGIDEIAFGEKDTNNNLKKADYKEFLEASGEEVLDEKADITNITTRHLVVYKPTLDDEAKSWNFNLNNQSISVDISETRIAQDTMARGDVRIGDTYEVKL